MQRYFSTFISGFQTIIPSLLKNALPEIRVDRVLDGVIEYESEAYLQEISHLRFLNNSFVLIKEFGSENMHLNEMLRWSLERSEFLKNMDQYLTQEKYSSIRVVVSLANEMITGHENAITDVERILQERLVIKINRSNPDTELWFYARKEGGGFIGIRIRKPIETNTSLQRGELRPELCNILCALSNPEKNDIFLDPFCGSGAIVRERVRMCAFQRAIAGDIDTSGVSMPTMANAGNAGNRIEIMKLDATDTHFKDHSISKIVTDPPWGESREEENIEELYSRFLHETARILKNKGVLVLLTSQKELTDQLLDKHRFLNPVDLWDILVSGKKARVYKVVVTE